MDYEPVSVALKFAFLAVLYLFLFWIAKSARRDLRQNSRSDTDDRHGFGSVRSSLPDGWLVVEAGNDITPGSRYDLFGGVTLGRSADADITFTDRYASGLHARLYPRGDRYFLEDMNSTNGTLLDGRAFSGEQELDDGSRIRIGDTEFRVEMEN